MHHKRIICTTLGFITLACTSFVHAESAPKIKFTLDWRYEGPSAPALVAEAKGYFRDEGLDVSIDTGNGSASAVQRLAAKTHQIGFADTAALIEYTAQNPKSNSIKIVYMLMEQTPATVFALKSSGIKTPKDLENKKLAAPVFDGGRKNFPIFAKANNIDITKIHWTNVDPAMRETLLVKGEFDAITSFYYTGKLNLAARGAKSEDLVEMKFLDHGVNLYGNAVMVDSEFAASHPETIKKFLKALNKGLQDTIKDPAAATQIVVSKDRLLNQGIEQQRLDYYLNNFVKTPASKTHGLGSVSQAKLQSNIQDVAAALKLPHTVPVDAIYTQQYLPALAERQY